MRVRSRAQVGTLHLPKHPFMVVLRSIYLISVDGAHQKAYVHLKVIERAAHTRPAKCAQAVLRHRCRRPLAATHCT